MPQKKQVIGKDGQLKTVVRATRSRSERVDQHMHGRSDHIRMENGERYITPFPVQDSSVLSLYAKADCLLIRPANATPASSGDACDIILLQD